MAGGKRLLLLSVAVLILGLIGYRIYLAMLSEETRIHRLLAGMAEAFNEGRAGGVSGPLAPNFTAHGLGRDEVHAVLVRFFFTERVRPSGELRYQVEVIDGGMTVEVEKEDPARARVEVTARFQNRSGPAGKPVGTVKFTGQMVKVNSEWRLLRADHQVLEGRLPL